MNKLEKTKNNNLDSVENLVKELEWTDSDCDSDRENKLTMMKKMKHRVLKERGKDRKKQIKRIKKTNQRKWKRKNHKKIQMSKIAIWFIFINCTFVELYSMLVMFVIKDLSALSSLITSVITQTISFAIYSVKSYKETKEEEKNKLEREKLNSTLSENIEGYESEDDVANLNNDESDNNITNNLDS